MVIGFRGKSGEITLSIFAVVSQGPPSGASHSGAFHSGASHSFIYTILYDTGAESWFKSGDWAKGS